MIAGLDTLLTALYVELTDRIISLANPKLHGEREQARATLEHQPANRPAPGTAVVTGKLLALNAVIWHNWTTSTPVKRSLISYDH